MSGIIPVLAGIGGSGGPSPYVAKAVHSDGTSLLTSANPFPADSSKFVYSGYMRCDASQAAAGNEWMTSYPNGFFSLYFAGTPKMANVEMDPNGHLHALADIADGNWHNLLVSVDTTNGTTQLLVDGISSILAGGSFNVPITFNTGETNIQVLGDGYGDNVVGDFAQIQMYVGQFLDFTVPENVALFYTDGHLVDPAGAIAALGTPTLLFDGDHAGFLTNQGSTGGGFTLSGSALTDATPPWPAPYVAKAVHFDGTMDLHCDSLSCTDSPLVLVSEWSELDDVIANPYPMSWVVDPANYYSSYDEVYPAGIISPNVGNIDSPQKSIGISYSQPTNVVYHHKLTAFKTDAGPIISLTINLASSSTNQKIISGTGAGAVLSNDGGQTWALIAGLSANTITSVASSSDGQNLAAVEASTGTVYLSVDGGATWAGKVFSVTPLNPVQQLNQVSMSDDGQTIVITGWTTYGRFWLSKDGGTTFNDVSESITVSQNWVSCAVSSNGLILYADTSRLYKSVDGGTTWSGSLTEGVDVPLQDGYVTCSRDGQHVIITTWGGAVGISHDFGATWVVKDNTNQVEFATLSDDGQSIFVTAYQRPCYLSTDGGATWASVLDAGRWVFVAGSADGTKIVISKQDVGSVQVSANSGSTWASVSLSSLGVWSKLGVVYVDDVNVSGFITDRFPSFTPVFNGLPFYVGSDNSNGDFWKGKRSDFMLFLGVNPFDENGDILESVRRLFISAEGKPVDPAVAIAALGAPVILLQGDASTYGNNQGDGGEFVWTGTPTTADGPVTAGA